MPAEIKAYQVAEQDEGLRARALYDYQAGSYDIFEQIFISLLHILC